MRQPSSRQSAPSPLGKLVRAAFSLRQSAVFHALFTWLAHGNHYRLCALLFRWRFKKYPGAAGPEPTHAVLYLHKGGLNEDVEDSVGKSPAFQVIKAHRPDLQAMCAAFLPEQVGDYSYLNADPVVQAAKDAYRAFLDRMWGELEKKRRFDVVLSGNIVYYAEREFSAMLESRGVAFVCLHKECLKSPGAAAYFTAKYRTCVGPFQGRLITVYNEVERQSQIAGGIIPAQRIKVVGMPRLDRCHAWRRRQGYATEARPLQILFFFFNRQTSLFRLPPSAADGEKVALPDWTELLAGVTRAIVKTAVDNPDIKVVVKTKGLRGGMEAVRRQFFPDHQLPGNLALMVGGDVMDLVVRSRVVFGFNSTSLLEAMACGIPVVLPRFGEVLLPEMEPYLIDMEDAVEYATSPDDLALRVQRLARAPVAILPELGAAQARVLDKWLGNADGNAGARVVGVLREELQRRTSDRR